MADRDDQGGDDVEGRLAEGREQRLRRRRSSRRLSLAALVVLLVSALAVPGDMDWLRALLMIFVVALHVLAAVVSTRGDEAARRRLATVSMWVLLALGVATIGVGIGYSLAEESIPADFALFGPILAGLVVMTLAHASSDVDPQQTVRDARKSQSGR